ncbi:MAG: TonB family protein [Blastocatellia bacterium]|nr:TonB family protein [Blastocatellia bacterium]
MRSQSFITDNFTTQTQRHRGFYFRLLSVSLCLCGEILFLTSAVYAQRIAILTPEKSEQAQNYAADLANSLSGKFKVLDGSMSEAAFRSVSVENPLNMSSEQSKAAASVIGCDFLLLIKTGELRRASFAKPEYYESFMTVYVISGRTGRLVFWDLKSFEADTPAAAEKLLFSSTESVATRIREQIQAASKKEIADNSTRTIEEVPAQDSPEAKNFRPPLPYKRIKPEYTRIAYLYDVRATVDISVDIDDTGTVERTDVVRWAGFGLDESVVEAVRKMNWRPAYRNGRPLPMRVLLRYNFTKIEKDQNMGLVRAFVSNLF